MPPKKFNKPVKDSILIAKNNKYSVETNEKQRMRLEYLEYIRCIVTIIIQFILFCFLIAVEIVYLAEKNHEVVFVVLAITDVFLLIFLKAVQINSIIFIKQQPLKISTNIELILLISLVAFGIFQAFYCHGNWEVNILPCVLLIGTYFITACFQFYLTHKYIIDYMSQQQNLGIRKALISQASFEDMLRKSMTTSGDNPAHFSIAEKSQHESQHP